MWDKKDKEQQGKAADCFTSCFRILLKVLTLIFINSRK